MVSFAVQKLLTWSSDVWGRMIFCVGKPVLCTVGCLAASLASTRCQESHLQQLPGSTIITSSHCQMSAGGKINSIWEPLMWIIYKSSKYRTGSHPRPTESQTQGLGARSLFQHTLQVVLMLSEVQEPRSTWQTSNAAAWPRSLGFLSWQAPCHYLLSCPTPPTACPSFNSFTSYQTCIHLSFLSTSVWFSC